LNFALLAALAAASTLVVIWVGYPAALAIIARLRPVVPPRERRTLRGVSVIVATRETGEALAHRVQDLMAQHFKSLEVVVGIDSAAPGDGGVLRGMEGVRWVKATGAPGKAGALNAAVSLAAGEVLVFADVAQRFDPGAVGALVEALANPALGIVSGELKIGEDDRPRSPSEWYWRYERWVRATEAVVASTIGVTGAIYAMPRALWAPLPSGCILDDLHTPMRLVLAGHRVGFERKAVAVDSRRFAGSRESARKVRTQTGLFQLLAILPGVLSPRRNPVFLSFLFHKVLRLFTPLCALVLVASVGLLVVGGAYQAWGRVGVALVVTLASLPLLLGRIRAALGEAALIQWALVRATINGFRGRWDVWT
jgi:hypothetical protein